ncbi:MAG: pseudouridine synthase [Waddliaceae bacterium]
MKKKRLAKFLAAAGVASRRACEQIIFHGRVKVNGKVTLLPQTMVDGSEKIEVDGQPIDQEESKAYYLLNKPPGYLCTAMKNRRGKVVLDLFQGVDKRLFTVGRLDKDTTGLLIITNDGNFANRIIHPSSCIQKEYVARTGKEISADHLKTISAGTEVEGKWIKPLKVKKVRKGTVKVVIGEGKKREVRHLIAAAELDVKELKRTRIGGLKLGNLPVGYWREMTGREKEQIFE